jgi:hypothetical protein
MAGQQADTGFTFELRLNDSYGAVLVNEGGLEDWTVGNNGGGDGVETVTERKNGAGSNGAGTGWKLTGMVGCEERRGEH